MAKETLTSLFGAAGADIDFVQRHARRQLRRFARKYPLEVTINADETEAVFETEDQTYKIRIDQNENLDDIYVGTIVSYCPQTVEFDTGPRSSLDECLKHLIVGAQNV